MALERRCKCGKERARLHHGNSVLPEEAIKEIYCPSCSGTVNVDPNVMIADNGWIVEYDMEVAHLYASKMGRPAEGISPAFIFDEGFCSWQGFTPNDQEKANEEKTHIAKVARDDARKYLHLIREWGINREKQLAKEGWRKAQQVSGV
ncbi:MAG: hypothetical protein R3231_10525 [bacterium]|nr:hypothetical protein [bacterium]